MYRITGYYRDTQTRLHNSFIRSSLTECNKKHSCCWFSRSCVKCDGRTMENKRCWWGEWRRNWFGVGVKWYFGRLFSWDYFLVIETIIEKSTSTSNLVDAYSLEVGAVWFEQQRIIFLYDSLLNNRLTCRNYNLLFISDSTLHSYLHKLHFFIEYR